MKMSIIVPAYNIENYLHQCVDSILQQEYTDFELFLIDDGSTDQTAMICDEYQKADRRISVIHKKNGGPISARREGSYRASGDYIVNIDGDDYIGEGYLGEIAQAIETSQADFIAWSHRMVRHDGKRIVYGRNDNRCASGHMEPEKLRKSYFYDRTQPNINRGALIYSLWTKAVRRDIYMECLKEIPDQILEGEDAALIWLILNQIHSAYVCDIDQYYYRSNPVSITHNLDTEMIVSQRKLEEFLLDHQAEDGGYRNQIAAFLLYRAFEIIERYAQYSASYSGFLQYMKLCEQNRIFDVGEEVVISKPSIAEKVKMRLLEKRNWTALYLWYRYRFR